MNPFKILCSFLALLLLPALADAQRRRPCPHCRPMPPPPIFVPPAIVVEPQPLIEIQPVAVAVPPDAAYIDVPEDCRVRNRPGGQCIWAACELLGRYSQEEKLYGITERAMAGCWHTDDNLRHVLDRDGVPYQEVHSPDEVFAAIKARHPVEFFVRPGTRFSGPDCGHAMVAVGYDGSWVWYIGNNADNPADWPKAMSRQQFEDCFGGYGCFLKRLRQKIHDRRHPNKKPVPKPNPDGPAPNPDVPVVPVPPKPVPDAPPGPTLDEIGKLIDGKLKALTDAYAANNVTINNRLDAQQKQIDEGKAQIAQVQAAIRVRVVPANSPN